MMSEGELVLVTGASGYIATHVVQQLQQAGYRVRGTVRSLDNEKKLQPLRELCPGATHELELVAADLTKDDGWDDAVAGCDYVIHTASPFPPSEPKNENEVIEPAVQGTLRVLKAIRTAKTVRRCVLTSSLVAVFGGNNGEHGKTYNEENWTDTDKPGQSAYVKSKTMAEKAAWDFVKEISDVDEKFELAVLNPGLVVGPVLCGGYATSTELPRRLLQREIPMIPQLNMPLVDVRDVAKAHVVAMTLPEAAGNRHCLCADEVWFKDMAEWLSEEFDPQGYNIPCTVAPKFMLWIFARFDASTRMMYDELGKRCYIDKTRMKTVLGIDPISPQKSLIDMGYSMIENGMVKKSNKYKGPPEKRAPVVAETVAISKPEDQPEVEVAKIEETPADVLPVTEE